MRETALFSYCRTRVARPDKMRDVKVIASLRVHDSCTRDGRRKPASREPIRSPSRTAMAKKEKEKKEDFFGLLLCGGSHGPRSDRARQLLAERGQNGKTRWRKKNSSASTLLTTAGAADRVRALLHRFPKPANLTWTMRR